MKTKKRNEIRTTVNYRFIDENFTTCRGIVLPGGTRSAKTISVCQWIVAYCYKNTGKKIIIARDKLATLKDTVLTDFEAVCKGQKGCDAMHTGLVIRSRTSQPHAYINGNLVKFIGLNDDVFRTHGMESDIFYINEAVNTFASTFKQLNQRCNDGWIMDCNPSEPNSWVYDLDRREDVKFFQSSYVDNPFLKEEVIKEIESYEPYHPEDRHLPFKERRVHPKNIEQGTADARMWNIYGLGEVHKGSEIIFPEWEIYTDEPEGYDHIFFGVDWGWNDPFAFIQIIVNGKDLYIKQLMFGSCIKPETYLERIMKEPLLVEQETYLVCDNSEPKSINTLQENGIPAMAVKKPKGSINDGIKKINGYNLHIHVDSDAVQWEANNYKYKIDEKTDTVLDVPIDKNNHAWDAIRYPILTFL